MGEGRAKHGSAAESCCYSCDDLYFRFWVFFRQLIGESCHTVKLGVSAANERYVFVRSCVKRIFDAFALLRHTRRGILLMWKDPFYKLDIFRVSDYQFAAFNGVLSGYRHSFAAACPYPDYI